MATNNPDARPDEQGYVLITAIWLLLLAGSIAALLMLRSIRAATDAKEVAQALGDKVALESAVETVLADRLFSGARSSWWATPARGTVRIGSRDVRVSLTSESGRIDINEADPLLVGRALQGLGVAADMRSFAVTRLQEYRATGRRITANGEIAALIVQASATQACLGDNFTLTSGLPQPLPTQMSADLARALGSAIAQTPAPPEIGVALRVKASLAGTAGLIVVARTTGLRDTPLAVSEWRYGLICESG